MSNWHIGGYGLHLEEAEGIGRYLKQEYKDDFMKYGGDWWMLFVDSGYNHDGITVVETDGLGDTYLSYCPSYPWMLKPKEKELTSFKDIEKDIIKYLEHFFTKVPDNLPFRELDEEGWRLTNEYK